MVEFNKEAISEIIDLSSEPLESHPHRYRLKSSSLTYLSYMLLIFNTGGIYIWNLKYR